MKNEEKIIWQDSLSSRERSFLRPISVAIVCVVFIGLFLFLGIMDSRRSDRTLTGFMENRGLTTISVVRKIAEENLKNLIQASQRENAPAFTPLKKETFAPENWLTSALAVIGQDVDEKWQANQINNEYLQAVAARESLWMIAVLDKTGKIVFQGRPSQSAEGGKNPGSADPPFSSGANLISLLNQQNINYVALQRKDGSGTVVIALEKDALRYWGMRVAVEKAMEKLGEGRELVYLVIMDREGRVLGQTGNFPASWKKIDLAFKDVQSGKQTVETRKIVLDDRPILDITTGFKISERAEGVARIGLNWESAEKVLSENRRNMIVPLVFTVIVALLAMWLLYHDQNRHMAGIIEMERRLEKAERLSSLGQLAAGVAHEIRNPLNAISMASQRLKREFMPADPEKAAEFQNMAGVIRDEIRRLNGIIEEFLTFSKSRRLEMREYPITEVLRKMTDLIREEAESRGIELKTEWSNEPVIIPMDVDKLQQALFNLVKNAMESISGEGSITISLRNEGRNSKVVRISDTGCGMTTEEVEKIFNPEYTTKQKGLGLGLSLAHEIVRGHGGEIRVLSREKVGTTFEVVLPSEKKKDNPHNIRV
jgi:signal transduction histidine kinase